MPVNPVQCWVDVQAAGVVVGDGPIFHVVSWTSTAQLSKAGTFTLTVAASDPRAALLQPKRTVHCWAIVEGTKQEIGAGIIDRIDWDAGGQTLIVSGSDLLAELRYRSVHGLKLYDELQDQPTRVLLWTGTWSDLIACYDNDLGTSDGFTLNSTGDFLLIGYSEPFNVFYSYQATAGANANRAGLHYGYSNGADRWPEFDSVLDTISTDGIPWAAATLDNDPLNDGTGTVIFPRKVEWQPYTYEGTNGYWIRIDPDATLTSVEIDEFVVGVRSPTHSDLSGVMGLAPTPWPTSWDDAVNGSTIFNTTADGTYAVFAGELVLAALVKIAERSGESFRLGPNRTLQWLHSDGTVNSFVAAGARAVQNTGSGRQAGNVLTCQIVSLEETQDTNDLVTRIYPYGAGNGQARVSLKNATDILSGVTAAALAGAGTGYTAGDVLTIVQGDASGATVLVDSVGGGGAITGATVTAGGMGYAVATGLATTVAPPGGTGATINVTAVNPYLLDRAANYIVNRDAETAYNRIERVLAFKDVRGTDDLADDSHEVCDQLAQAALTWLQRHSVKQYFYRLTVVGLHKLLQVGTRIHVIYREAVAGRVLYDIDDYFVILSATHTFAAGEIYTTALEVGTTDVLPASDTEMLADMIEQGIVYEAHTQPVASNALAR